MRTVAALYVDPRGPYPKMPGVDCWDEARDARKYAGPHPVVAHPPCGPWSRLRMVCKRQDASLAPLAVQQVRRWGGVLEHPESSTLWRHCSLPMPGEFPDEFGGWSVELDQCSYGHVARKRTKLYIVGVAPSSVRFLTGGTPTHRVARDRRRTAIGELKECSAQLRRRTPPAFAEFLVELARKSPRHSPRRPPMKLIDCSRAYDGQGAFRNGMHDRAGRLPFRDNLYRLPETLFPVGERTLLKRVIWSLGWLFQAVTKLGFVVPLAKLRKQ